MKCTIGLLVLAALAPPGVAPPRSCWGPATRAAVVAQPPAPRPVTPPPLLTEPLRWKTTSDDPGRAYLYRGNRQVGGYDLAAHYFRPLDPKGTWGPACAPPIAPPC